MEATCEYFFPIPEAGSTTLDGLLPTGRTEFVLGTTEWQHPDWSDVFASLSLTDRHNLLDLDLSGLGGVEFDLYDSMGQSILGPVQVELRDGKGSVLRHLAFHRAPYRTFGLASGDYSLTVHRGYSPWDDSAHSETFRVRPGEFVHVECVSGEVKGR
jgi:hypothetical protein